MGEIERPRVGDNQGEKEEDEKKERERERAFTYFI